MTERTPSVSVWTSEWPAPAWAHRRRVLSHRTLPGGERVPLARVPPAGGGQSVGGFCPPNFKDGGVRRPTEERRSRRIHHLQVCSQLGALHGVRPETLGPRGVDGLRAVPQGSRLCDREAEEREGAGKKASRRQNDTEPRSSSRSVCGAHNDHFVLISLQPQVGHQAYDNLLRVPEDPPLRTQRHKTNQEQYGRGPPRLGRREDQV